MQVSIVPTQVRHIELQGSQTRVLLLAIVVKLVQVVVQVVLPRK